jgi:hypothetical protein
MHRFQAAFRSTNKKQNKKLLDHPTLSLLRLSLIEVHPILLLNQVSNHLGCSRIDILSEDETFEHVGTATEDLVELAEEVMDVELVRSRVLECQQVGFRELPVEGVSDGTR